MSAPNSTTSPPAFRFLETERLHLRAAGPDTLSYIYNECPPAEGARLLGLSAAAYATEKDKFTRGYTTFNKSFLLFYLLLQGSDAAIGWCGFHTWYTDHARAEIGYVLYDDAHKGKGYMGEALGAVLGYGFRDMGLHRAEAFVAPGNEPSMRLLQRYGFVQEGLLRQHYFYNGQHEDSAVFGLLRHEWLARNEGLPASEPRLS